MALPPSPRARSRLQLLGLRPPRLSPRPGDRREGSGSRSSRGAARLPSPPMSGGSGDSRTSLQRVPPFPYLDAEQRVQGYLEMDIEEEIVDEEKEEMEKKKKNIKEEFQGKEDVSATNEGLKLDDCDDENKKKTEEHKDKIQVLCEVIKEVLGDKIEKEQVLDREATYEEHHLRDTAKRVSTECINLGWNFESWRSYKAFKKLIKKVMGWKIQGRRKRRTSSNSYREEKLLDSFSNYETTEDILDFLRLVVAILLSLQGYEYVQIIPGLNESYSLKDWCFRRVLTSRTFMDHVMMAALGTALEILLRVDQLYGRGGAQDIYTGPGVVNVTLLYTGNHYDIICPRGPAESSSQHTSQREHTAD